MRNIRHLEWRTEGRSCLIPNWTVSHPRQQQRILPNDRQAVTAHKLADTQHITDIPAGSCLLPCYGSQAIPPPTPLLWVTKPLKSDLASPFEDCPLIFPSSPVENTLKKVPTWSQKIILPAFSINSFAIFTLGRVLAGDLTASSKNIPEPKYLVYYLWEISLNEIASSQAFSRTGEQGRSSGVFHHHSKHKILRHLTEMAEHS